MWRRVCVMDFVFILLVQMTYAVSMKNEERSRSRPLGGGQVPGKTEGQAAGSRRGLHFPSVGQVVVHLPSPAKNAGLLQLKPDHRAACRSYMAGLEPKEEGS